ncbi:hypothetical protein [Chromobacterium violaceum]|uniref:hypothetical protein n=1 Tax=Chromobacterium violaceum TaxID=536 RepID=UPI001FD4AB0F|nr:hypothetical protein [Chromobacterium violaceum]
MKQVDAAAYVGMCDKTFRKIVMPHVPKIPIFEPKSKNSPVEIFHYDRMDLDTWIDDIKRRKLSYIDHKQDSITNHQHNQIKIKEDKNPWQERQSPASHYETTSGTLTSKSKGMDDFEKALALTTGKKRSVT